MAYLMHIGFDNSSRLCRDIYYFEYKGIKFKLIQNNIRKWCDVLLTIIPGNNNKQAKDKAYLMASEFLSALSWENNSFVKLQHLGGMGIPENFKLRNAKCRVYSFPQVPFHGYTAGYDINPIPEIETEEQRDALILFREASSSNNYYLSFLFFWQIIEIGKNDAIGWINKTYRKKLNKIRLSNDELKRIPLNGKKLGNYFYDDCRNAIAHIFKPRSGRIKLKVDTPDENLRIKISNETIKEFTRFYIIDKLKLQKHIYLVREKGKSFPIYVNEEYLRKYPCKIAYERPSLDRILRSKRHK